MPSLENYLPDSQDDLKILLIMGVVVSDDGCGMDKVNSFRICAVS